MCLCLVGYLIGDSFSFVNIGQHCYGCTKNGNPDMMHPDSSVEYIAGHLDVCLPFGRAGSVKWSDSEEDDAKYV